MTNKVVYIGAESVLTPLGETVEDNICAIRNKASAIRLDDQFGPLLPVATFKKHRFRIPFEELVVEAVSQSIKGVDEAILSSEKTLILISSTKGEINLSVTKPFESCIRHLVGKFLLKNDPIVISSACISGVAAINLGARYIQHGYYEHVIVVGCDVLSSFVINGFSCLYAISPQVCRPFDGDRAGVNLGEASAAIVLSSTKGVYKEQPLQVLDGAITNDANHISGPSRTGEGLYRAVKKTMEKHQLSHDAIGFISAHGTATAYNDEMEAIAFGRLGLENIPLNSYKGYIGHTLGAAGVVETVYTMQGLRQQQLWASYGFQTVGTSVPLNIIQETQQSTYQIALKTASGFGGCNAALALKVV